MSDVLDDLRNPPSNGKDRGKIMERAISEIEELRAAMRQVDDVLAVNWVGPRKDGDYRKALHDLVSRAIQEHDDPAVSESVSAEHIKLLRKAYVSWVDCEYGAPAIDCKRPYGNSDVESDVARILGWPDEGDDGDGPCLSSAQRKRAREIHHGTKQALNIILRTWGPSSPKEITELRYLLKEIQTVRPLCLICGRHLDHGSAHAPDCKLAAALKAHEAKP